MSLIHDVKMSSLKDKMRAQIKETPDTVPQEEADEAKEEEKPQKVKKTKVAVINQNNNEDE